MNPTIAINQRFQISDNDLLVMDAIGWDVVNPGTTDFQSLYNNAAQQLQTARVQDRNQDVTDLLDNDAYNWVRRSSSNGFWQEGYFATMETQGLTNNDTSNNSDSGSNDDGNNSFVPDDIFKTQVPDKDTKHLSPQDSSNNNVFPENPAKSNPKDDETPINDKSKDEVEFLLNNPLVDPLLPNL